MAVSSTPRHLDIAIDPRPRLPWAVAGLDRNRWRFSHRN